MCISANLTVEMQLHSLEGKKTFSGLTFSQSVWNILYKVLVSVNGTPVSMMLNPHCIVLLWEVSKGVEYFLGG